MYRLKEDEKINLIESGRYHEEYSFDSDPIIRINVAMYTDDISIIERLMADDSSEVRASVASHHPNETYRVLMYDSDWLVRRCLIDNRIDTLLDEFRYDEEWMVRSAVAGFGRDEDFPILINDENEVVRLTVVWNTNIYNLINYTDKSETINRAILSRTSSLQYTAV